MPLLSISEIEIFVCIKCIGLLKVTGYLIPHQKHWLTNQSKHFTICVLCGSDIEDEYHFVI